VGERLGVRRSRSTTAAAWAAEKVGRLKFNGQIKGYSPLSRLVELEGLATGIESKQSLWLALAQIRDRDDRLREIDLDALAERARSSFRSLFSKSRQTQPDRSPGTFHVRKCVR
jgi:hypothetical protein